MTKIIRPRSGRRFAMFALVALIGCHDQPEQHPRPSSQPLVVEHQLPNRAQSTLIKRGKLPLVYLVDASTTLRFTDLTTGKDLARALVQPRQIVSIDADRGVCMGDVVLRAATLPPDHEYGIWLEPQGENVFRNIVINPPQTQPSDSGK